MLYGVAGEPLNLTTTRLMSMQAPIFENVTQNYAWNRLKTVQQKDFYSFSNLAPSMVQREYQRAKGLKFSFLVVQMLKVHWNEAIFIQGAKSTNFQGLKF